MFDFKTVATVLLFWMIAASVTLLANQQASADDDFTAVGDQIFTPQVVTLNPPTSTGILDFPTIAKDWASKLFRAATLQSPIWDSSWTNPIRIVLLTIMGAFLFVIAVKGAEIAAQALPF